VIAGCHCFMFSCLTRTSTINIQMQQDASADTGIMTRSFDTEGHTRHSGTFVLLYDELIIHKTQ